MAYDCLVNIIEENNVELLIPNSDHTFSLADRFQGKLFTFEMAEVETMTWRVSITPNDGQPINMTMSLFKKVGGEVFLLGTSLMTELFNQFTYDGVPATYFACFVSNTNITATVNVEMTDYPYTILDPGGIDAYTGSWVVSFEFARVSVVCDGEVAYKLVGGTLSPGTSIHGNGLIDGLAIPEMDCLTDIDVAPSFTWHEFDEEKYKSTGLAYHFTVQAFLLADPTVTTERDFYIPVHNNWDDTRDQFLAAELEQKVYTRELPTSTSIEFDQAVEEVEEITAEEIKKLCEICLINEEFTELISINKDSTCDPCDAVIIAPSTALQEIEAICDECDVVETSPALTKIDPIGCCEVETVVETSVVDILYEGLPIFKLDECIEALETKKCYAICPNTDAIYPEPIKISKFKTIESICQPQCD